MSDINVEIVPAYAIIDYVWELLQLNTSMQLSDYGGRIPVIPSSEQPEFANTDKPFLVYAWSETTSTGISSIRSGQISFAIYANSQRDMAKIANIINTEFNDYDDSATRINQWKSGKVYAPIRFTTLWSGAFDGPTPEDTEGGRSSSVVIVRFRYVADYVFERPAGILP